MGAIVANIILGLAALDLSDHARSSCELWISEVVVTFGMVLVIFGLVRSCRVAAVPYAVGAYITSAILFNLIDGLREPAATVARSLSDTFAAIALNRYQCSSWPSLLVLLSDCSPCGFSFHALLRRTPESTARRVGIAQEPGPLGAGFLCSSQAVGTSKPTWVRLDPPLTS